jgi:hypothetical protein
MTTRTATKRAKTTWVVKNEIERDALITAGIEPERIKIENDVKFRVANRVEV